MPRRTSDDEHYDREYNRAIAGRQARADARRDWLAANQKAAAGSCLGGCGCMLVMAVAVGGCLVATGDRVAKVVQQQAPPAERPAAAPRPVGPPEYHLGPVYLARAAAELVADWGALHGQPAEELLAGLKRFDPRPGGQSLHDTTAWVLGRIETRFGRWLVASATPCSVADHNDPESNPFIRKTPPPPVVVPPPKPRSEDEGRAVAGATAHIIAGFQASLTRARISRVNLIDVLGKPATSSTDVLELHVLLTTDDPGRRFVHTPWAPADGRGDSSGRVLLRDKVGNRYTPLSYGIGVRFAEGLHGSVAVHKGAPANDVMVFDMPVEAAGDLLLDLDASELQPGGKFTYIIPKKFWREGI